MNKGSAIIELSFVDAFDRDSIYQMRHKVYASELRQHSENEEERLTDQLDAINCYIVAKIDGQIAGFVSITPPNALGYSIDKYFTREEMPIIFDKGLYEIRLLTVINSKRGSHVGALLCYGALCYIESLRGKTIVAIGREEVLELYLQVGMKSLGRRVKSGMVTYELMFAKTNSFRNMDRLLKLFEHLEKRVDWKLHGVDFLKQDSCYHGGDFFEAIGDEFDNLQLRNDVINADVLDAWFDPSPNVLSTIQNHLFWSMKTSAPTGSEGMCRMIAKTRGIPVENILPGAGSSDLIYLGLRQWILPSSKVLILDPMYGEYAHLLEKVIVCKVDRFPLSRMNNYSVDTKEFAECLKNNFDWVILVNPNSPTGQHIEREEIEHLIINAPQSTRFWIDETYIDFLDSNQTLEHFALSVDHVMICKSMSKAYALSGARCAYLCGPRNLIDELRSLSPPWAVSLPAQIAVCEALRDISYYRQKWIETSILRKNLLNGLTDLGWDVVPGCANFLLCHLPSNQPEAAILIAECQKHKLYLRDVGTMGQCFDNRTIRIAVKDEITNLKMLRILKMVLNKL